MKYSKIPDPNAEDAELSPFFLQPTLSFCPARWLLVVVAFRDMDVATDTGTFSTSDTLSFSLRFLLFFLDSAELIVEVSAMRLLFLFLPDLLYVGSLADGNNVPETINRMLHKKRLIHMYIEQTQ